MRDIPLAGVHAVVTGASRGIGREIATRLAELGASIALLGRDMDRLSAVSADLAPASCVAIPCDVRDQESVSHAFAAIAAVAPQLAILVNNAGAVASAPLRATTPEDWAAMLDVNLTGAYRCTRAALPLMRGAAHGRIVNVASTAGLKGYPYVTAYCAAKHGLVGFTRALAAELAHTAITVNAVCPGYTDTDLVNEAVEGIARKTGRTAEAARASLVAANPQGRLVAPEEVAATVAWLCSPESQSVTGQAIAVCGGEVMAG